MFATKTGLCITKNTHMEDLSSAQTGALVKVGELSQNIQVSARTLQRNNTFEQSKTPNLHPN